MAKTKSLYLDNKLLELSIAEYIKYKKQKMCYEFIIEDLKKSLIYNKNKNSIYENKTKEYTQICELFKNLHNKLTFNFITLAEHIIKYKKFNLVEYDDAMQEFVMICFDKMERFDPTYVGSTGKKSKAFNYLTTCIFSHYKQMYRSAKNYNDLKKKYQEHLETAQKDPRVKPKKNVNNLNNIYKDEFDL